MTVYTPPRRPRRKGGKGGVLKGITERIRTTLERKRKSRQSAPQAAVSGAQRGWRLKRFSRSTLLLIILVGCTVAGLWASYRLLAHSDIFRLTDVEVGGTQVTNRRQILDLAGLEPGISLLTFRSALVKAKIAAHPWVEQVEVVTRWPSRVEITVREYRPIALINIEEGMERRLRYVDRNGRVFADVEAGQDIDYPVLTGSQLQQDVVAGAIVKGSLTESGLSLLLLASRGNAILPIQAVSEVHVDPKEGLILFLNEHPFPIHFGREHLQVRFSRLIRVLDRLYNKKQIDAVRGIRMDYSETKVLVTGAEIDG